TLMPYKQSEKIGGWQYVGMRETILKRVSFNFKETGSGDVIALELSKPKPDKPADAYTKLFNIHFIAKRKSGEAPISDEEKAFAAKMTKNIAEREGLNLKETRKPLEKEPLHFVIPAKYKDKLFYDGSKKELVFRGVMTSADKKELMKISDNPQYSTSLIEIYNQSNYYFRRSDNWRWIFWILGPPGLIFALMAFFMREPVKGGTETYLTEKEALKLDKEAKPSIMRIFKTPSVVLMIIANILATFCVGGLTTWLFPFVERFKGIESSEASIKMGPIVILFTVAGVIVSGILADKLFKKTKRSHNILIAFSIIAALPFMYIFLYTTNRLMLVGSISICMFFLSWINGPQNSLLVSLVEPKLRASLNAVHILLIHVLGDAISPLIIAHFSDRYSLQVALSIVPIFLISGCILFAVAGIFVPKDLADLELRMKSEAA
ncbi:MAG TPA: MFS transporter, partial [bacterium]|nr:MFS transporter [bacterium]